MGSLHLSKLLIYLAPKTICSLPPPPQNLHVFISAAGNLHKAVGLEVTPQGWTDWGGDSYTETYLSSLGVVMV